MAGSAENREEAASRTRSAGRTAPGSTTSPAGEAPDGRPEASDSEVLLVSAGSLVRPPKPLRAAPRCTILGIPGSIALLPRTTGDHPGGASLLPPPVRAEAVSPPAAKAGARFHRGIGAAVALGGAAALGALTAFTIGERLLWSDASAPSSPTEPEATSSAAQPVAAQPVAVQPAATPQPRVEVVDAFGFMPEPVSSETPAALPPPWRDRSVVPSEASQLASEEIAALVRDNLRLDAEVVALEAETTKLQEMLLDRELRLFSAGLPLEGPIGETEPYDSADALADVSTFPDEDAMLPSDEDGDFDALEPSDSDMTDWSQEEFDEADLAIASATIEEEPLQRFVVADVPPGSLAESAGLVAGDIVLAIDDIEIIDIEDLIAVEDGNVEDRLHELTIDREGERFSLAYADHVGSLSLRLDWVDSVSTE